MGRQWRYCGPMTGLQAESLFYVMVDKCRNEIRVLTADAEWPVGPPDALWKIGAILREWADLVDPPPE